jgi:plastocyanin
MVHFTAPFIVAAATLSTMVMGAPLPRPNSGYGAPSEPSYSPSKSEPYKYEEPKYEEPKYEQPKYEQPKYEAPKYEQPKYEPEKDVKSQELPPPPMHTPVYEPPKYEAPKYEPPKYEPEKEVKSQELPPPPAPTQAAPEPPKYGSGGEYGNDYNSCVSKCMATYGAPSSSYSPPPQKAQEPGSAPTTGKVHTVLVAPVTGVLRYVPPMLDVPVGDTVKFVWNGPTNHTVSKASVLDLCNRTADAFFTSGVKNGTFEFTRTVNDTGTTYFYCSVGVHCSKGMFGMVNPPKGAAGGNMTVEMMMPKWTAEYPDLAAAWSTVKARIAGTPAETWANTMDVTDIPVAQQKGLAENIVYYRDFLSQNPGVQELNSGATLPAGVTSFNLPQDITQLLTGSAANPAGAVGAAAGAAPTDSTPTGPAPEPTNLGSGAGSIKSSGLMVAVVAVLATFMAL